MFINQINNVLSDNRIAGDEHKAFVDQLLEEHGVFVGAKINSDHSNAKRELILAVKED